MTPRPVGNDPGSMFTLQMHRELLVLFTPKGRLNFKEVLRRITRFRMTFLGMTLCPSRHIKVKYPDYQKLNE